MNKIKQLTSNIFIRLLLVSTILFIVLISNTIAQTTLIKNTNDTKTLLILFSTLFIPFVIQILDTTNKHSAKKTLRNIAITIGTIPIAIICIIMTATFLMVITNNTGINPTSQNQNELKELLNQIPYWRMFLLTVVNAPIVEEFMFRHMFLSSHLQSLKSIDSIKERFVTLFKSKKYIIMLIIQSCLFAIMHLITSEWPQILLSFPSYAFIGLFAGLVYSATGSSKYNILFHAIYNYIALSIMLK